MKKSILILLVAALFVLGLPLFAGGKQEPVERPGKVITIGTVGFPEGINPFITSGNVFHGLIQSIYDTLFTIGEKDRSIQNLPTNIDISADLKTYTITIRDNATWYDGKPLTAEDVAFSYNYTLDNELGFYLSLVQPITEVKAIDDYVVQITLKEPINQEVLEGGAYYFPPIIPKHIWENMTVEDALGDLPLEKAHGSGPYQIVEYKRDEYLRLQATDFAKEELGANVDEYIIKAYVEPSLMLEDLIAGNIDAIYSGLDYKSVGALEGMSEITTAGLDPILMEEVVFNCWDKAYEAGRETHPHPALRDVRVKQAMDWALDEEFATKVQAGEYGIPGCQYLNEVYFKDWANTELDCRGYDLDKARQILDDAGYLDTDGDGIRETAKGLPLEFDVWTETPGQLDVATLWAREVDKIGIKFNVSAMDGGTLWTAMNPNAEFDIAFCAWNFDPDPHFMMCTPLCEQAVEGGWSECGWCNSQYDEWYVEQAKLEGEERKQMLWKMQKLLHDEMPYIIYSHRGRVVAWRNDKVDIDRELVKGLGSYGIISREFLIRADVK